MSQRLPIELWQSILCYSISVPIFFDVDPTATNSIEEFITYYRDEQPYWASERRRNKLRRVCSAWDIYLQQFDHRFVRLQDIIRDELPRSVIRKARRVKSYVPPEVLYGHYLIARRLVYYIAQEEGEWAVTILDGGNAQFDDAVLMSRKTPHLKSIPSIHPTSLTHASHLFPSLRLVLLTKGKRSKGISLPSLTMLHMYQTTIDASYPWKFGSLQHLSFQCFELKPATFIEMLRSIGQNLITCFDDSYPSDQEFPDETWSLCPRLQQIQTSFTWPADASIPPSIQCIRIPTNIFDLTEKVPSLGRLPALAILKAGIQNVRLRYRWWKIVDNQDMEHGLDYLQFGMEYGIFLQDKEGTDFSKFLVTLLSFYWKRNIRHRPRMLTRVAPILF